MRHLDRGCLQTYNGHFREYEYVFGATAAAACYRRKMIEDISVDNEFFDPDFFTYREDADVAWRAQLLGWKCLYDPNASGYHVRKLRPGMRRFLPPEINMHSVKNRFLMRLKNITTGVYLRNLLPITLRDIGILGYCLLVEHSSLKAFYLFVRDWRACPRQAAGDPAAPPRRRRLHEAVVPLSAGQHPVDRRRGAACAGAYGQRRRLLSALRRRIGLGGVSRLCESLRRCDNLVPAS